MDKDKKLVVPEINAHVLGKDDKIIANPNCSTVQMVLALAPLHRKYGINRIVVSTYQSVTGTGARAVMQLENERKGIQGEMAYPYPIDLNIIPHGGFFLENGYTSEEQKLEVETRKILGDPSIRVTATVVRVPVYGGHSEAVNVEFHQDYSMDEVRRLLTQETGVVLLDDPQANIYPMPLYSRGGDDVFVGRLRRDQSRANSLNLFIVADNLRKGAATNAVQIARYLDENNLLS
jgi:aspartate-semialdehyde dehydrogenase